MSGRVVLVLIAKILPLVSYWHWLPSSPYTKGPERSFKELSRTKREINILSCAKIAGECLGPGPTSPLHSYIKSALTRSLCRESSKDVFPFTYGLMTWSLTVPRSLVSHFSGLVTHICRIWGTTEKFGMNTCKAYVPFSLPCVLLWDFLFSIQVSFYVFGSRETGNRGRYSD
jgi:hypothetical protein